MIQRSVSNTHVYFVSTTTYTVILPLLTSHPTLPPAYFLPNTTRRIIPPAHILPHTSPRTSFFAYLPPHISPHTSPRTLPPALLPHAHPSPHTPSAHLTPRTTLRTPPAHCSTFKHHCLRLHQLQSASPRPKRNGWRWQGWW